MAFGEEIGNAYIEVHADSRPFRRELKRDARRAGREAGSELGAGMSRGVDDELDDTFSRIGARTRASMTRAGFRAGEGFGEQMKLGVEKRLRNWNINLADSLITGDFSKVAGEFEDLDTALERIDRRLLSLRKGGRLTSDEFRDARRSLEAWGSAIRSGRVTEELDAAHVAAKKLNEEMNKRESRIATREFRSELQALTRDLKSSEAAYEDSHRVALRMNDAMRKGAEARVKANQDVTRTIDLMNDAHRRFSADAIEDRRQYFSEEIDGWLKSREASASFARSTGAGMRALERHFRKNPVVGDHMIDVEAWNRALARVERDTDVVIRRVGRNSNRGLLGSFRGARNNFLNAVGIFGGAIESTVGRGMSKVFDTFGSGLTTLGSKMTDFAGNSGPIGILGRGFESLGDKVSGIGKGGLDGLVVQLGVFVATMVGVMAFIGPLVAGLSGLIAIFTALAVTIGGAVLGAIGSLLPILAALVAVAGTAVVGVMGMTDAMKDMLKPLQEWFDTVKTMVAGRLFSNLEGQVSGLVGFLNSAVTPALEISADALRNFIDGFVTMVNSPAIQDSMRIFRSNLPTILENLGRIFNAVFGSIVGIVSAAGPVVANFLESIAGIAEGFSTWANSSKGREEIRTFFEKAATAAETLFGIIGQIGGILGTLFEEGSGTGQKFLDTIEDLLTAFNTWLGSEEGRAELASWFQFAEDLASKLWEVMQKLGELWDKLDTPENRMVFLVLIGLVGNLIDVLGWFAEKGQDVIQFFQDVKGAIGLVGPAFERFQRWVDDLLDIDWSAVGNTVTQPFEDAWTWLSQWFTDTKEDVARWFNDLFDIDWSAVGATILSGIQDVFDGIGNPFESWSETFTDTFGLLPGLVTSSLTTLPTAIVSPFSLGFSLVSAVLSAAGVNIPAMIAGLPRTIGGLLSSLPGIVSSAFSMAFALARGAVTSGISSVSSFIAALPGRIGALLGGLPGVLASAFSRAFQMAQAAVTGGISTLIALVGSIPSRAAGALGNIGNILYSRGQQLVQGLINGMLSVIPNIASTLASAISSIRLPAIKAPSITMPTIPDIAGLLPWNASGSIVNGAQMVGVGEAGPEAIVPLYRPLSQVDPSVRALSAFAQGLSPASPAAAATESGPLDLSDSTIQRLAQVVLQAAATITASMMAQKQRSDAAVPQTRPRSY
jgi:hypothetical protein